MSRAKLTDINSIPQVIADLTLDEKLNLVGEYGACHTLEIPDMNIPSVYLLDGATGVNGAQVILDFISKKGLEGRSDIQQKIFCRYMELAELNCTDLTDVRERYREEPDLLDYLDHLERFRPQGKSYISFPSGVNIGASFDQEAAEKIGEAIGWELRSSGVDLCMGPNVDVSRDPLGGRGYEMYGEDPHLVGEIAVGVVKGIQKTGVGACAKHFLANNQETNRNTKDTHVSERVLRELYGRGFYRSIQEGGVKAVMSAYNAINGEFTSYSKKLLTDWLRGEMGFDGLVVCDWGAVKVDKERSLEAGMDLILCGPNDMSGCKKAIEDGTFSEEVLDRRAEDFLKTVVWLREEQSRHPLNYDCEALKKAAYDAVVNGSVLLKNQENVLPLENGEKVTFYGKRSKSFMECGTGSTAVVTDLHSNVFDEFQNKTNSTALFETMESADVLVYTVTAPAGENVDRKEMDIEKEDRERLPVVLKKAKEAGLKTVVILNVSGPVDMRSWIEFADSVLCLFIPGCMGGAAAADLLLGKAAPGGRLPVTFPLRVEDTPSYPNFPGEYNDVYYGEGLFVGYKSYEKRKLEVMYPFGYGLSYTEFDQDLLTEHLTLTADKEDSLKISVRVKNTGSREGSQVIQVYARELKPHVIRPEKELVGFGKATLRPGEETVLTVEIPKETFQYYDIEKQSWVLPVGMQQLYIGTSAKDIFAGTELQIIGESAYKLSGESTIAEILKNEDAVAVVDRYTGGIMSGMGEEGRAMMAYEKLADYLKMVMVSAIPDAVKLNSMIDELSEALKKLP
ncbi:MAG: glycoside hydrolase family 3 C-terminal domain-containing protein [Clostridiales bacterium]|nr:glycoside hydrolase family 3 C-terminal domain-containing protein [Clostridiales bacterium]